MATAHTFKHEGNTLALARVATALVWKDLLLGATVNRDLGAEFAGKRGAVINVPVPATLTASERDLDNTSQNTDIVTDDVSEDTQPVALTKQVYNAVDVTTVQRNLEIKDYSRQVTAPQALAIVENIEDKVVAAIQGVAVDTELSAAGAKAYDPTKPVKTFTAARKKLRDMGIPMNGLFAAVGTEIYQNLLDASVLQQADMSGSTAALRDANVGRLAGFTVIESNRLADDELAFYHRDGIALVLRAPLPPMHGAAGSSIVENGVAITLVQDYDARKLQDRQVLHVLVGAQTFKLAVSGTGLVVPVIHVDGSAV